EAAVARYPDRVETETYKFGQTPFAPCDACGAHKRLNGECRIKDGFQELRDKYLEADGIIYSVPVYHMGIPGQVKCFIDRLGNSLGYYFADYLPGEPSFHIPRLLKVVGTITQGSHIFAGQEHVQAFLNTHAMIMRCIPVPGDLWESYIGAAGWTEVGHELTAFKKLAEAGTPDARIALRAAQAVALRVSEMAFIVRSGIAANSEVLEKQPTYVPVLQKIAKGTLKHS
ncbi:MAG TPA: flavodoxin family protein, partial [Thermodesulfobacteriota bacterium]|nr:flavodoxin family protein [Thermodesulfobacteriota bacterium]